MLVVRASGASIAYVWMALAQEASLIFGVIARRTLLGIAFAVLVAPSVPNPTRVSHRASTAASRVVQLAGVALAAGANIRGRILQLVSRRFSVTPARSKHRLCRAPDGSRSPGLPWSRISHRRNGEGLPWILQPG